MFDAPMDALPVWFGLTLASLAVLGVTTSLPTTGLDATAAAGTVDAVATSPHEAVAEHPLAPGVRARVTPDTLTLVRGDARSHQPLRSGPVTPVRRDSALGRVLLGVPPSAVFDSPAELARARDRARRGGPAVTDGAAIRVRQVSWGEVDVTLVG